ncbi:oxidoreductase [Lentzea sp. NBRC 105346]|uniref:SDR family oxidoreductase n=1 Tax=Lentzea sp. NBRC 105346 TaxID=3032205 RepID=UPI00249FCD9C|nr:SDR family oxidoreductase [Lentzea sp. NBRC 105346]GLZ28335.1 oxidoreductase [Lentzea sp. NBRC 105346]
MATVITGGSRGIGAATARRLAAAGHQVVISYRQHEPEPIEGVTAVQADVTNEADVERLFDIAEQVTAVVNNAGITSPLGPLKDARIEDLRRVIDVNVMGALLVARAAAQRMTEGAIVNVSSGAATTGSAGEYVHYAASKAAIDTLTIGLAKELAPQGIRVNAVAPGITRTEIHTLSGMPDRADRLATRIPLGRAGEPDEVAAAIAWLLGDEASYVTGAILRVGGGL